MVILLVGWLMAGPPSDRIRLPRLRSSGWGSSALARDCCWRQPDLAPSKRRRETAERAQTSREDETYDPSCRYRPLKVISFVSSLDAIHGTSRIDRESLHTTNKQRFEKVFNHFRRKSPARVEFGACEWRRARGDDARPAIVRARIARARVATRIVRGRRHFGAKARDHAAKFRVAFVMSGGWRALGDSESKIAAGGGLARAADSPPAAKKSFFDNKLENAGERRADARGESLDAPARARK